MSGIWSAGIIFYSMIWSPAATPAQDTADVEAPSSRPELPGPPLEIPSSSRQALGLAATALGILGLAGLARLEHGRRRRARAEAPEDPIERARGRLAELEEWRPVGDEEAAAFCDQAAALTREALARLPGTGDRHPSPAVGWCTEEWMTWLQASDRTSPPTTSQIERSLGVCDRARFGRRVPGDAARERLLAAVRELIDACSPPGESPAAMSLGGRTR